MTQSQISRLKSKIHQLSTRRLPADWHSWLVIAALCMVAFTPLLRSSLPHTHDGILHYFRVVAMRHALQDGLFFTRYFPDMAFGYGSPFFNYRAPLSYYLPLAFYLLGLSLPAAFNLLYLLSILGSAFAAYLLARDLFGPRAGLIAAVAYAYAPYQFLDALLRGNLPESVALVLFPLILWAFRRLALTGRRRWFIAAVGSLAALYVTHNISSLLFTPLLLGYLATLWLAYRRAGHWAAAGFAFALALGLAAFFWGPALLEMDAVQLHLSHGSPTNDFHYHFVSLADTLAPPEPVDTALMNPPVQVRLGLALAILGGLGLFAGLIRWPDRERRASLLFFAFAAAVMIGLSTPSSLWLWEQLPLISFVQFPWRFVGRATLPVALLAGALLPDRASPGRWSRLLLPLVAGALILSAFSAAYPLYGYHSLPARPTIKDLFAYERQTGKVGINSKGSFLPIGVKQRPEASLLEEQYATASEVARFDESTLPPGASILGADYGPNRARLVIESPVAFRARYLAFYFPGWRVAIDGAYVPVAATDPEGLITFDVPAGRSTVAVRLGLSSTRAIFNAISFLSLLIGLVAILFLRPFSPTPSTAACAADQIAHESSLAVVYRPLLLLAFLLLAFKLLVVDRMETPFRHSALSPDGSLSDVQVSRQVNFDDRLILLGYDLPSSTVRSDEVLDLTLYWRVARSIEANHTVVVSLVDDQGRNYSWKSADHHTAGWEPTTYARDQHFLSTWPGTPPGEYGLLVSVYDAATGRELDVLNTAGAPSGVTYRLADVRVTRPRRPLAPESVEIARPLRADLGGGLRLLGFDPPPDTVDVGDRLPLTLYWQAQDTPSADCFARLSLIASEGARAFSEVAAPGRATHPTTDWRAGDIVRDGRAFLVPAAVPAGEYTLRLDLVEPEGTPVGPSTDLLSVTVSAPERNFSPPPIQHPLSATLGSQARLLGYDLSADEIAPGQPLTVTLHWRAEATGERGYVVFVHLLDGEERMRAQSDREPVDGARPTTSWLRGEILRDLHPLLVAPDAPPGQYLLEIGMYDPAGGERLPVLDARGTEIGDRILLPTQVRVR